MGYSKEKAVKVEDFQSKYMSAGINENCTLDSVEIKTSPTGNKLFQITFSNEDGQTLTHTEWEPKLGGFTDTTEKLEINMNKQYKRMLQILYCFYKDEEIDFNGESFSEFAKYIADKLNGHNDVKLRIKAVYNKDGYLTLPNSVSRIFIEPMLIPKEESKIVIDPKYDNITRPIVANKEVTVENPFKNEAMSSSSPVNTNDDLPF